MPANIKSVWKGLQGTNGLAYSSFGVIDEDKGFRALTQSEPIYDLCASSLTKRENKLERFSLESTYSFFYYLHITSKAGEPERCSTREGSFLYHQKLGQAVKAC